MAAAAASGEEEEEKKKLQERVPIRRTAWMLADFVVLFLLALLFRRATAAAAEHDGVGGGGAAWRVAFACEAWFAFVWLLNMNAKWSPARFDTYAENLAGRIDELPAVDMFVTTADPELEAPVVTVNTVLSLLAVDYYPGGCAGAGERLACYVSDDGCSPVTYYALREAAEFARAWVPLCGRRGVAVRAPFRYFASTPEFGPADRKFLDDWTFMKSEYDKLVRRIEDADETTLLRQGGGEFAEFMDAKRTNHPAIVKQEQDRRRRRVPASHIRLKGEEPRTPPSLKAGAMNALTRVSAVMTNAPIMLNVDCDMFANDPQVVLHAMCLLLGFDDEISSGFVQVPQSFYGDLKDDPFGNKLEVIYKKFLGGVAGIQGLFYGGTGCFHRTKAIYGIEPDSIVIGKEGVAGSPSYKELQFKFGSSEELKESARSIISGDMSGEPIVDISSRIEVAKEVSTCNYESGTRWGLEVIPYIYKLVGPMINDRRHFDRPVDPYSGLEICKVRNRTTSILGLRTNRWTSLPNPVQEMGNSQNNPLLSIFKHLQFRQCLAYLTLYVWAVRGFVELCYELLVPYCLLTNQSFLSKASENCFNITLALFLTYNTYNFMEYMECGLSVRAWWNNHRMQRIISASAWLLAFFTVLLKTIGLSETVFEVTRKEKSTSDGNGQNDEVDPERFTFDASPVFIPVTALTMLNIVAMTIGTWRAVFGTTEDVPGGPGISEFMSCGWLLLCFFPFVRGLVWGKGSYGIPLSVKLKASGEGARSAGRKKPPPPPPLQERVPLGRRAAWAWRLAGLAVLLLLLALLAVRLLRHGGGVWRVALVCEARFAALCGLNVSAKWSPVRFVTRPENLVEEGRTPSAAAAEYGELPAVDMLVTTADPALEPPLVTVNTVLSLLALDYPRAGERLACYVSDDGCSPLTCHALREAAGFAAAWVPFCRRYGVAVRAPFRYFSSSSSSPESGGPPDRKFLDDWKFMKDEYDKLVRRIKNTDERSLLRHGGGEFFAEFLNVERRNHPTIVKVLWDNSKSRAGEGFPHLIYISREKSPSHHHHYKAGAMNVLTRVSAVMTNAPIMLNMDCDMFVNNPQAVLHAMCLLLGFDDEASSGFVQAPQRFYDALKDDPFGNQMECFFKRFISGVQGVQGAFYAGTGCFHRRKAVYGVPPNFNGAEREDTIGSSSYKELHTRFGNSEELNESARNIIWDLSSKPMVDISSRIEVAKAVSACNYDIGTCWGQEVGWVYGSLTEDILTGQRIYVMGWRSVLMVAEPPAFMGSAPIGGPACLTQFKRWATGQSEIIISQNNPILATMFKRLKFRQCLAYLTVLGWPLRAPFELCYGLLGPYCILTNQSFLPKASEDGFSIPLALFISYNTYNFMEYMVCGLSARAWWNNHRMQRIISVSAWTLAFLTVLLKSLGLSETVFEVTVKDKSMSDDDDNTDGADPGRFTFDSSPVFIPVTALAMLNIVAVTVGACRVAFGTAEGVPCAPGIGEFMCCGWLVLCFFPFVRGLVWGKGSYGIPWSVKLKASLLVAMFVTFCKRN
uniref:Cellulose synthase-like protein H1 n=1 Tax=Oryza meridionalis TaxID=40149 RepID=A0A0E0DEA4_9ORYZ